MWSEYCIVCSYVSINNSSGEFSKLVMASASITTWSINARAKRVLAFVSSEIVFPGPIKTDEIFLSLSIDWNSFLFLIFALAALGLPGTTGFLGEFLILMGVFKDNFLVAVLASLGVILGAAYMLWLYKRVVFGKLINTELKSMVDLNKSEYFLLICLAIPTLFFGIYPDPLINTIEVSVNDLINMYNINLNNK